MTAYYNEFDPFAAAWLRELIKDGLIADGVVDERSITEVEASDLHGFTQCHFFAGIGGWSCAARLAGWPDDRPMWTGSPPCQPFSVAGNQKGKDDLRHLWPAFFNLIRKRRPTVVFGEQVASAIRHEWFDDLQADMEGEGYATAMVVLGAHSVNAPHKRDRLVYVAERLADSIDPGLEGRLCRGEDSQREVVGRYFGCGSAANSLGDTNGIPSERNSRSISGEKDTELCERIEDGDRVIRHKYASQVDWRESHAVYCRDGKYRPIPTEPSLFPLVNGVSNRVGILRGAGNAIVPQVGSEFIKAYMELRK